MQDKDAKILESNNFFKQNINNEKEKEHKLQKVSLLSYKMIELELERQESSEVLVL